VHDFLTFTIIGLCTAGIFAVAASGLVLTYTTTGVFNFAHGAIGMLGAFAYWQLHVHWSWPTPLALAAVLLVAAPAAGLVIERTVSRPLEGAPEAAQIVVTIGLLSACLGLGFWLWSPQEAHPLKLFWQGHNASILGVSVSWHALLALVLGVLVAVGLRLLLYETRAGVTMRATVADRGLALLSGSRPTRSAALAWSLGCALAALAGILIAAEQTLSHTFLTLLIVDAFAAAVFGRLRSLPLTFLGAVILGLAESYATRYIPSGTQHIAPYLANSRAAVPVILLFIVLLVLPQSRLRGHRTGRSREHHPRPTWSGTAAGIALVLVATAVVVPMVTQPDALRLGRVFALAIIALSLVPLVGWGGQISLCQMSFAGIGAVVMSHLGASGQPIALLWAALVAGAVGAVIALPALRLSGIYLALATLAFAVTMDRWLFKLPDFHVGGTRISLFGQGNLAVVPVRVPGLGAGTPRTSVVVIAVAFVLGVVAVVALRRSRLGDRLLAMKDSPIACATVGMNLRVTKLAVFTFSAAMAGVGGALYAGTLGSVSPDSFGPFESLPVLLLAVVWGVGSWVGALLAGLSLAGLPVLAATFPTLANPIAVLPGALGLTLGKNPNGVVRDLARRLDPLRRSWALAGTVAVALAVLVGAQRAGALSGWWFGVLAVVAVFGVPAVATLVRERPVRAAEPPLEWAGIDRPFAPDDVRRMAEVVG
jgi:branched-chain amino acid transport system permease protein